MIHYFYEFKKKAKLTIYSVTFKQCCLVIKRVVVLKEIPQNEQIVLLGDFNARVGTNSEAWPICLELQGHDKLNDHDQRLLELCTWHNLCITNSYFKTKPLAHGIISTSQN